MHFLEAVFEIKGQHRVKVKIQNNTVSIVTKFYPILMSSNRLMGCSMLSKYRLMQSTGTKTAKHSEKNTRVSRKMEQTVQIKGTLNSTNRNMCDFFKLSS
jgi:hypothetical protein